MFRTYEHVLEENIKMWGIIHVHKFLINMWEYNLWECNLWERVPSPDSEETTTWILYL